jgi:hypothetical protein
MYQSEIYISSNTGHQSGRQMRLGEHRQTRLQIAGPEKFWQQNEPSKKFLISIHIIQNIKASFTIQGLRDVYDT